MRPLISAITALLALAGCAYNATGTPQVSTIVFEFSVASGSQIVQSSDVAYYLVLNDSTDPTQAPLINGSAPQSHPYSNPYSYLPFVRDDEPAFILDRFAGEADLPKTYWKTFYALYQSAGVEVMYQGQRSDNSRVDGTINEQVRQLQSGREWGITGSGNTVQITLPITTFLGETGATFTLPPQFEANLAVARRAKADYWNQLLISRYGITQNAYFTVPTAPADQTILVPQAGVQFPGNLPSGIDQNAVNFVSFHYKITNPSQ